jgi:hypothetical protein
MNDNDLPREQNVGPLTILQSPFAAEDFERFGGVN